MRVNMTEYGSYWQEIIFIIPDGDLKKTIQEQRALGKDDDDRNMSSIEFNDGIEDSLYEFIENFKEQQVSLGTF